MSKETIVYEVKLQPVVIVLLGVIALGLVGNVFKSVLPIQDAKAFYVGDEDQKIMVRVVDWQGNDVDFQ